MYGRAPSPALVRPGTAACHQTAAWVHGAGNTPPVVHHVKRCVDRRIRPVTSARVVFHDTLLPAADVLTLSGVAVSSPARTMLDLATTLHRDPRVLPWMDLLAVVCPRHPGRGDERAAGPSTRAGQPHGFGRSAAPRRQEEVTR